MKQFEKALLDSVTLLQELPRARRGAPKATVRFKQFRRRHANIRCDLLVNQPPGTQFVDYDILLGLPDGSTLNVTLNRDNGLPWIVEHADHWAANYVVTVNGSSTTIQSALLFLKFAAQHDSDLMEVLVNQHLIEEAAEQSSVRVSQKELQAAADAFRRRNRLYSADATERWLRELGLTAEDFADVVRRQVKAQKLKVLISRNRLRPYFRQHRCKFDRVRLFYIEAPARSFIRDLLKECGPQSLMSAAEKYSSRLAGKRCRGALLSSYSYELPEVLSAVPAGGIAGPLACDKGYWATQILHRLPAKLDDRTVKRIEDLIFAEWLSDKRKEANVEWHWL